MYNHQILKCVCVCVCARACVCVIIGDGVVTGTQGLGVGHSKTVTSYSEHYWMVSELKKPRLAYAYNLYMSICECKYV